MKVTEFTKIFKYLRAKNDLTKQDLAKGLGISAGYIFDLENGNRRPNKKLAEALIKFYQLNDQEQRMLYDAIAKTINSLPFDIEEFLKTHQDELDKVIASMNEYNQKTL